MRNDDVVRERLRWLVAPPGPTPVGSVLRAAAPAGCGENDDSAGGAAEPTPDTFRSSLVGDAFPLRGSPTPPAPAIRPSVLRAFDPGRRGVAALAVVAAVVVVGVAVFAWRSRPQVEPLAEPVAGTGAPGVAAAPSATPSEVVVAVAGRVRRPGLVRVPAGARVADALEAAGGVLPGTDVTLLNVARRVSDGELIVVGITPPPDAGAALGAAPLGPPAAGGKLNLNTATLAQLDALPGVGPVLAQRILDLRQRLGGFRSVDDLRRVEGIGDARFERLRELVTV